MAQLLEYAIHLPSVDTTALPPIPEVDGKPFVELETVQNRLQEGDYLLIVAGDRLDSRAVKLGKSLLGRHLVSGWDLALVEIAVFQQVPKSNSYLLVPHLRGAIVAEQRQVVRVVVEGGRPHVDITPTIPLSVNASRRKLSEEEYFAQANLPTTKTVFQLLTKELQRLRVKYSSVSFTFGTASIVVRYKDYNILEVYLGQEMIRFRPDKFTGAFGKDGAIYYRKKLESLFPAAMQQSYPVFYDLTDQNTKQLITIMEDVISKFS